MKVDWVDDWPVFNEGNNISLLTAGRNHVQETQSSVQSTSVWRANLDQPELELGWYQKSRRSLISP